MKTKSAGNKVNQKPKSEGVHVVVNDTMRVRAALNLSEAIKDLAAVIRGGTMNITIQDCTVIGAAAAGISVGSRVDEVNQ